jgi:FkbM family methyltransferase
VTEHYATTLQELQRSARRVRPLRRLRPNILATSLRKLLLPSERRGVIQIEGVGKLYVEPVSRLGRAILADGAYEPETVALFHEHVRPGDTVFDIGANEGIMSACAATLVGVGGCVVAIEPQSRLLDVLEINLALNSTGKYHIVHGAISDRDDDRVSVALYAETNPGASSIVRKFRWNTKSEEVPTFTIEHVAKLYGIDRIDFVKIDVEGYEPEVVRALHPLFADRRIGKVLVDYHAAILQARGVTSESVHDGIVERGYKALLGSPAGGYVLYGLLDRN